MKKTKILSGILCLMLVTGLATPASAAVVNPEFKFSLSNTGTAFTEDKTPKHENTKTQPNDPATIYCTYTNAPGWGYYLHLRSTEGGIETYNYWYNNTNRLRHPTYVSLASANGKTYRVWGRIDNDYYNNTVSRANLTLTIRMLHRDNVRTGQTGQQCPVCPSHIVR